jgi:PIN domain nuclease of toxin-antitoxin system
MSAQRFPVLALTVFVPPPANEIWIGAATPWEIAIKVRSGKLKFDTGFLGDFDNRLIGLAFRTLVMTSAHGIAAA